MIQPRGDPRPGDAPAPRRRWLRASLVVIAGTVLTALVATGVTLAVLQMQARTNPQTVNLRSGVTISQDSAIVQAAARAKPAVVSVVTQEQPRLARGSGYLVTTDGYIVTSVDVIAGANKMTVLVSGDTKLHEARLVDYDCQTGVAVIKIDQVSGLPTLVFADPTALVQGQVLVALGGPLEGGAVTPGYVSALHRTTTITDPVSADRTIEISDTVLTSTGVDAGTVGGPLLNVGGQVIAIAMQSPSSAGGFGLNAADVQDDVQQILQTGQLVVASLGTASTDLSPEEALLGGVPQGSRLVNVDKGGPAAAAGLQVGDVVTQLDDVKLDAAHPLRLLLRSRFHPNQRVTVTYTRAGASTQVQLTLVGQHPSCG